MWLERIERARSGDGGDEPTWIALADTFSRFAFPIDPWTNLAKAMSSDIVSSSFQSWDDLRQYMQGASVAPAIVFMYLVLMRPDSAGIYRTRWSYDEVYAVTEDLAIFCYLVHILRDVASDLSLGETGLVYLPDEELAHFGLNSADLHAMRESGRASKAYSYFARQQAERARGHLRVGRGRMAKVLAESEPAHGMALTTLVDTYERILNDLQDCNFDVFSVTVSGERILSKHDFD
jgi:phytoene synthase